MTIQEPTMTAFLPIPLPVLDAELVAIDGVPVTDLALIEDPWVPGQIRVRQPWCEDPTVPLFVGLGVLVTGIIGTLIYGAVRIVWAVTANAATIGGGIGVWVLLVLFGLLGGGGAVCAGLHCAGCRG